MSSIENQADDKDTIILNLRKIICDLQKENKELYKKLGIFKTLGIIDEKPKYGRV